MELRSRKTVGAGEARGRILACLALLLLGTVAWRPVPTRRLPGVAKISEGQFTPFYRNAKNTAPMPVRRFIMDTTPVTNHDFARFVEQHAEWRRGAVAPLLAEPGYLAGVDASVRPDAAVTNISWFAALAYCKTQGGRLPTTLEWEYAAAASEKVRDASRDPEQVARILSWYGRPAGTQANRSVGMGKANFWGLYDLNELVWEWTLDFNSVFISGDNRREGEDLRNSFCGAASYSAEDKANYAGFLRYAFRSSLQGHYVNEQLGFRCAYDVPRPH